MSLIEIRNLSLGYDKDIILKHVNLDIEENDFQKYLLEIKNDE